VFPEFKPFGDPRLGLVPRLYIYQDTLDRLQQLMQYAGSLTPPCEVQFYLTCTRNQSGTVIEYILDEMTFPPQEVQPAYVEASAEQQAAYSQDIQMRYGCLRIGAGTEPGTIRVKRYATLDAPRGEGVIEEEILTSEFSSRYDAFEAFKNRSTFWCHSHVNMAPQPSNTDEGQWKEWLKSFLSYDNDPENAGGRPDAVGMIIFNLKGNYFNRVKDNIFGVIHENLPLNIISRAYYTESFFKSYVAKKVAAVTQTVGNSTSKQGSSASSGYSSYGGYSSTSNYPSSFSPGMLGVLFSYPGSSGSSTGLSAAVKALMKKRADAFYEVTSAAEEKVNDAIIAGGTQTYWKLNQDFISVPLSASFQETIRPLWDNFIDTIALGHDIHATRTKNENLLRLIISIGDAIGLEHMDRIEATMKAETDIGLEPSLQKVYQSLTPSYGYCLLAIKIAQYLTSLQYYGGAIDYTYQKKILDFLFNDEGFMDSHIKLNDEKDFVIDTGLTTTEIERTRHVLMNKPMSFEALIWTLGVLERWAYGDNNFANYRVALATSFSHFAKRDTPPPMVREDLCNTGTSASPGPRLVSSAELEVRETLALVKSADTGKSSDEIYEAWLKNEYND
jgi:hypothetical protein